MTDVHSEVPHVPDNRDLRPSLREVAQVFLTLGIVGFGGPAAHVALMRREIAERRQWIDEDRFLDMYAACNLVPGPSSTELAVYLGYRRAGWRGMLLAGGLFILPAMLIMIALAWAYTRFGTTRAAEAILYGVRPIIIAVVTWAVVDLARKVFHQPALFLVGATVLALAVVGVNPLLLLVPAGAAGSLFRSNRRRLAHTSGLFLPLIHPGLATIPPANRLLLIFLSFLKIGAVSFGSGYVLLAFLHSDFVRGLHWLTDRQLLDAVAIGQATPGPVFTTATFLGYLFGGVPGALTATVAIFLPGFLLVPILERVVAAARAHTLVQGGLEGVNAGVLGLIGAVSLALGRDSLVDLPTVFLALIALGVLTRRPLSSPVLVMAGAILGLVLKLL